MIFSVICLQDNWNYCKFAKAAMKNKTGSNNIIQTLKYKSIMTKKGEIYICKHCGGMVEVDEAAQREHHRWRQGEARARRGEDRGRLPRHRGQCTASHDPRALHPVHRAHHPRRHPAP